MEYLRWFEEMLWRDLAMFLLFGSLLGVLLGVLLIFNPAVVEKISRVANRWISTRRINQVLDRSVSIEHWFYQHHRIIGSFIVLGAVYIFIYFGGLFDKSAMLRYFSGSAPLVVIDMLLDAFVLSMLVGAAVSLISGLFLVLRPSLLRDLEAGTNQWVSSRSASKVLDVQRGQVDAFVLRHAQRVGWLLLLGSIYLSFAMFRSLA